MNTGLRRNPYDTFFREAFGNPESARELALNLVPSRYREPLLRANVRITVGPDVFVDEDSREHQSDLLLRLEAAGEDAGDEANADANPGANPGPQAVANERPASALLYVLFEHKSNPDHWVAMQMLRYLMMVWHRERTEHRVAVLPPTVPVIVYHGTQEWNHSLEFADLVDDPGPNDGHVPRFSPLFVNLAHVTPDG